MNFFELRTYVERLRASGARVANYLVDLHLKLAFPLINLIVVLIGALARDPPAHAERRARLRALGRRSRSSTTRFMRTGQALGHNGALPPYLAAWLGDLVFGSGRRW